MCDESWRGTGQIHSRITISKASVCTAKPQLTVCATSYGTAQPLSRALPRSAIARTPSWARLSCCWCRVSRPSLGFLNAMVMVSASPRLAFVAEVRHTPNATDPDRVPSRLRAFPLRDFVGRTLGAPKTTSTWQPDQCPRPAGWHTCRHGRGSPSKLSAMVHLVVRAARSTAGCGLRPIYWDPGGPSVLVCNCKPVVSASPPPEPVPHAGGPPR
jgi:hypothetical protein